MKVTLALLFLFNFLNPLSAKANETMHAAEKAFINKNYAHSLAIYTSHLKKNGASIQLFDNIGTCYYKLAQWHKANQAFKQALALNPTNWKILYSLAVTEKKIGHIEQAINLFLLVFEQNDSPLLSEAAYEQIITLREKTYSSSIKKRLTGGFRIQYGYGEESSYSDIIDDNMRTDAQQVNASANINWYSHHNFSDTWNINAFIYHYQTLEAENLSYNIFSVGAGKYRSFGSWRLFLGASIDYSLLDTDDYLGGASITGSMSLPLKNNQELTASYTYLYTEPLNAIFDDEQGFSQEIAIGYANTTMDAFTWTAAYGIDDEKKQDDLFDTQFSNLSSLEQSFTVAGFYAGADWKVTGRVNYSYRHFNDDDLLSDGTEVRRIDKTWLYSSQLLWQISNHINIAFNYHYTDFTSSIDYQQRGHHQLSTSLSSYF